MKPSLDRTNYWSSSSVRRSFSPVEDQGAPQVSTLGEDVWLRVHWLLWSSVITVNSWNSSRVLGEVSNLQPASWFVLVWWGTGWLVVVFLSGFVVIVSLSDHAGQWGGCYLEWWQASQSWSKTLLNLWLKMNFIDLCVLKELLSVQCLYFFLSVPFSEGNRMSSFPLFPMESVFFRLQKFNYMCVFFSNQCWSWTPPGGLNSCSANNQAQTVEACV